MKFVVSLQKIIQYIYNYNMMLLKKNNFLLLIICSSLSLSLMAQKNSSSFSYILPYNYFEIEATLIKHEQTRGPLCKYANKLTENKQPVIKKDSMFYTFSGIKLTWKSDRDTSKIYPIETSCPAFAHLFKQGMIVGFEQMPDIQETYNFEMPEKEPENRFYLFHTDEMEQVFDTTYQEIYEEDEVVRIPKITSHWQPKSGERYAKDVANEIEEIRDTRKDLLSGALEVDFSRLDLMLEGLNAREADLAVLFTGYTEKTKETQTFRIVPQGNADTLYCPLFGFSSAIGFTNDIYTQRYKLMLCKEKSIPTTETQKAAPKNSLCVNLPAYYRVYLLCNNKIVQYLGAYPIAQNGSVRYITEPLLNIELNPYTGAIETLEIKKK